MNCNRLQPERLASGHSSLLARLLQSWHILKCPVCRAEYRREETTLSQLRKMAEAPASDLLRKNTLASLPASVKPPDISGSGVKARYDMKRMTYSIAFAALTVVVTGALAGKFFLKPSFGCSDKLGKVWILTGAFHGKVEILDANGNRAGEFDNDFGEMKETVEIATSGEQFPVRGVGRHEVRGKSGVLYGFAVLSPVTKLEYLAKNHRDHVPSLQESLDAQARDWKNDKWDTHNGVSGMESFPWGVRGFESTAGLRWRVSGKCDVRVMDSSGKRVLASGNSLRVRPMPLATMPSSLIRLIKAKEPAVFVSYGKRSWRRKGFGKHELKDESGKAALVMEIEPEPSGRKD